MKPEDKPIFDALSDWQLMGLCIEREAGGESREGRIAVGTVILERVDHRGWDGGTIHEVILMPWQFSWTMPEAESDYYNRSVHMAERWDDVYEKSDSLKQCAEIAISMLSGAIPRDPNLAAVHCCEYVAGRYRKHMDDHPEEKCNRWWQKMKLLKVIGNHEFYTAK